MVLSSSRFDKGTDTGVDPIGQWITPPGVYKTSTDTDKTVNLMIQAHTDLDPEGHNGVSHVAYTINEPGQLPVIKNRAGARWGRPNWAVWPARQGGTSTLPTWIWSYYVTLDLASMAGGTITVTAEVVTKSGRTAAIPGTITVYNDTDGTDRRPSKKTIYGSTASGTAGGAGTVGDPTNTLQRAIGLAVNNPAGTSASDRDAGGARIIWLDGMVSPGGTYGGPNWHTSGDWTLTVEAAGVDRTYYGTTENFFTDPDDYIFGGGVGVGTTASITFLNWDIRGNGFTVARTGSTTTTVTDIGCHSASRYWVDSDPAQKQNVNWFAADGQPTSIAESGITGGASIKRSYGLKRRGCWMGAVGYNVIHDFSVDRPLGVAIQSISDITDPLVSVGNVSNMAYKPGDVNGYADTAYGASMGGTNLSVVTSTTGEMQVEATSTLVNDFQAHLKAIDGADGHYWGVRASGFTTAANNGVFNVVYTGINGAGYPFAVLDNPSFVEEQGGASARLQTTRLSDDMLYTDLVHPDIWKAEGPLTGAQFIDIRCANNKNTRSWASSGYTMTRCAWINITDGSQTSGDDTCEFDFAGSDLIDCIFARLSISSDAISWDAGGTFTRTNFVDCVFGNGPASFPDTGTFIRSCHFVGGTTYGLVPSSGQFWISDPGLSPWSYEPIEIHKNTGSDLLNQPY